ncbi:hypothetical protein Nepgr_015887 [Nepenthes gracilis]|uniref:Uncharacterized protein n=1 Tax=Nepenthes gracilis TaxID=150966 RepID=A0AAD3SPC4_NEPGR|nr:hypothetical protein Nepgr_015887 [Nepenthes gracilis]
MGVRLFELMPLSLLNADILLPCLLPGEAQYFDDANWRNYVADCRALRCRPCCGIPAGEDALVQGSSDFDATRNVTLNLAEAVFYCYNNSQTLNVAFSAFGMVLLVQISSACLVVEGCRKVAGLVCCLLPLGGIAPDAGNALYQHQAVGIVYSGHAAGADNAESNSLDHAYADVLMILKLVAVLLVLQVELDCCCS